MFTRNHIMIAAFSLVAMFASYFLMEGVYQRNVAHAADTTAAAIDAGLGSGSGSGTDTNGIATSPGTNSFTPNPSDPIGSVTTAWGLIKQMGWIWGGMIVLFGLGTAAVKFADGEHWLSKDHYLPVSVGVLAVLGAVINAKFGGGSWAAVAGALMSAVLLIIQKPTPSPLARASA